MWGISLMSGIIVWLRHDLRLRDNPALHAASSGDGPVYPLYILEEAANHDWPAGSASRLWLHHSLAALDRQLRDKKSRLILRHGAAAKVIRQLLKDTGADTVYWNRRYEPDRVRIDQGLKQELDRDGYSVQSFKANMLFEPHEISNRQGDPYKVFTPFWKTCRSHGQPARPLPVPARMQPPRRWPKSDKLGEFSLTPGIRWDKPILEHWQPGTEGAERNLRSFLNRIDDYETDRDFPDRDGVSRLSPHLHFGEISSREIWHQVLLRENRAGRMTPSSRVMNYLRQLAWREFAHHLLFHFPHTGTRPLREEYEAFPWQHNKQHLLAWQRGLTGYPIVDAGMRELWMSGWMHNRVRMITGSFLVKDLLIHWLEGARWFWDTLVDADLANNTLGWQWVGGCGADAAPYFRIFNPITQSEKFDADGNYLRTWLPELARLDRPWIHKPWQAPADVLRQAGIRLGEDYPEPIVDHAEARRQALAALQSMNAARRSQPD